MWIERQGFGRGVRVAWNYLLGVRVGGDLQGVVEPTAALFGEGCGLETRGRAGGAGELEIGAAAVGGEVEVLTVDVFSEP